MEQNCMTGAIGAHANYQGNKKGITGFGLKMIAVITMLIDHTAATILGRMDYASMPMGQDLYWIMRTIGRMAFPIYVYLLVEGFTHTRNVAKYMRNMAIFAILSEVPFDMAFQKCFWDMSYNSVFLTLLLGLVTIFLLDWVDRHLIFEQPSIMKNFLKSFILTFIILVMMVVAYGLNTDYSAPGVAAIAVMYLMRNHRMVGFAVSVILLGCMCGTIEWAALLMLIPIYFYNGKRGKNSPALKYFFYAFYPVHLLILSLICYAMGLGI